MREATGLLVGGVGRDATRCEEAHGHGEDREEGGDVPLDRAELGKARLGRQLRELPVLGEELRQ